jgi:hypothetical protein
MSSRKIIAQFVFAFMVMLLVAPQGQTQSGKRYQLTDFDNEGCMAKGRVQDCNGKVMQEILADGKHAIPILVSQLTETARAKKQIADYWGDTRSGDVAFAVLTDLFTDADRQTFEMPDVTGWQTVMEGCDTTAQGCWDQYLRKHGRMSVKREWLNAWNLHKDQISWDPKSKCFRLSNK